MTRQQLIARKMMIILAVLLMVTALLVGVGGSNAEGTSAPGEEPFCLSDELLSQSLKQNPALHDEMEEQESAIRNYVESQTDERIEQGPTSNFIIPVAVYIVHSGGPVGVGENLSEQQVNSQIAALNNAFSGRGVQFCLATTQGATPLPGSPTPGIIRIQSPLTNHLISQESSLKALSTLPGNKYLRIWVVEDINNNSGVAGYARFPGTVPSSLEGIVMRYDVFGDVATCGCSNLLPNYDQGKILAHEAGHYLNLYHTFHGGCSGVFPIDCATVGDRVCDTPQCAVPNTGCPSSVSSCSGAPALLDNEMDYTNDLCRNAFTTGQETRMLATLNTVRQPLVSPANLVFTGVQCAGLFNAAFLTNNYNPCTNQSVTFDALNIGGATYAWDFGDGSTGSGDPVSHTYTTSGTYTVTLTVTSGGNSVSSTQQVFVTACTPISSTQGNWYFGQNAALNFSTGTPVAVLDNGISFTEACVTESDAAGNLLFYSNSVKVFDKTHTQMPPGTQLSGDDSASNGAISIPDPGNANRFYLIYRSNVGKSPRLSYTIVNFGNSLFPNGELTSVDTVISAPAKVGGEQVTAVPNCAGTGYWVIAHSISPESVFFVYSLTASGISFSAAYPGAIPNSIGILKASPNGTMLAQTGQSSDAAVYNFDRATGAITLRFNLSVGNAGCSFSPDSKILYTAGNSSFGVGIFQYDLTAPDPNATVQVVTDSLDADYGFVILQLGPDKKIYASQWGSTGAVVDFLPVINYPNQRNTPTAPNACGYSFNGPSLQGRTTYIGLPNMIDALPPAQIPADFSYDISSCSTVNFSAPACAASYAWNFGDSTTSNEQNPTHIYAVNSTYTVTLTLNGSTTVSHSVKIGLPASSTTIYGPSKVCIVGGNPPLFNYSANASPGLLYNWTVTGGTIAGFSNNDNVDVVWSTLPGTVQLTVTNPVIGCTATTTLTVNHSCKTAQSLPGNNVKVKGNLYAGKGEDHYLFSANAGDRVYAATITNFSNGSGLSFDTDMDIYDSNGALLESDDNNGHFGSTSSSIAGLVLPATGEYLVRIYQSPPSLDVLPYDLYLRVQSGSPTAEVESNNTIALAKMLPPSGWVSGNISPTNDKDTFWLNLNAGETVFISLDAVPVNNVNWNPRLHFGLFDNNFLIANDPGTTPRHSEAIAMTVRDAGKYYVKVDSQAGGGLYHLSVSIHPPPDRKCTTYTRRVQKTIPLAAGIATSTLIVPGNPKIANLKVKLNIKHSKLDELDVSLVAPDGNEVVLFDDPPAAAAGTTAPQIDLTLDDEAALPVAIFGVNKPMYMQPEGLGRLYWFKNQHAGGTWTLKVRDDGGVGSGTLNTWGITVCEDPELACGSSLQTTIFSRDFETNDGSFTHSGTADEWEHGLPTYAPITTCHSGTKCWKTDLSSTYNNAPTGTTVYQDLKSPIINLAGVKGQQITFEWAMKYQIAGSHRDHAFVEVREVAPGTAVKRVWEWAGPTMTRLVGNPLVLIRSAAGWGVWQADISEFSGKKVQLVFHLDENDSGVLAGFAIDDVKVTANKCPTPRADFDGNGLTNLSVVRPTSGSGDLQWLIKGLPSPPETLGTAPDKPVAADYEGDGKTDKAVFQSNGNWRIHLSSIPGSSGIINVTWGNGTDKPVPGDYDGDCKADKAVFRPDNGSNNATWFILSSSGDSYPPILFGSSTDKPVQADYDGDCKTDVAVFRDGVWYIAQSFTGTLRTVVWGLPGDTPVPGDYDGDRKFDVAVWRIHSNNLGYWHIYLSATKTQRIVQLGETGDKPVPGDYDGDRKFDVAVFRPTAKWDYIRSSDGVKVINVPWSGGTGVIPVPPSGYVPD